MPLTSADLISPVGELAASLFPGEDLETFVTAWLTDATERTDNLSAQRAWVYHRAYTHVANRMHAGLASESKGSASASRDASQFRYWARKAAAHLSAYRSAVGITSSVAEVRSVW